MTVNVVFINKVKIMQSHIFPILFKLCLSSRLRAIVVMVLDPVPWFPLLNNFPQVNGHKFNCLYAHKKKKKQETFGRSNTSCGFSIFGNHIVTQSPCTTRM